MSGPTKLDPYGRTLAYVFTPDGLLLQQELLQQGFAMARVYQEHPFWECFAKLEQQARTQRTGLWVFDDYAPKAVSAIGQQDLNQYRLVRGVVTDFERKGQYLWLILDNNFYVGIPQAGSGNFSNLLALNSLKRAVIVRGKLYFSYKKWQIIATHPSQISLENPLRSKMPDLSGKFLSHCFKTMPFRVSLAPCDLSHCRGSSAVIQTCVCTVFT